MNTRTWNLAMSNCAHYLAFCYFANTASLFGPSAPRNLCVALSIKYPSPLYHTKRGWRRTSKWRVFVEETSSLCRCHSVLLMSPYVLVDSRILDLKVMTEVMSIQGYGLCETANRPDFRVGGKRQRRICKASSLGLD